MPAARPNVGYRAHVLILDTFNVLHAAPRIHEQLRGLTLQSLIRLIEASRWAAGPVILACDGTGGRTGADKAHFHPDAPIRILFSGPGKDADTLIERLIIDAEHRRGSGRGLTVVSSDKGVLASAVGPIGPKPTRMTSEAFLRQLIADVSRQPGGLPFPNRACSQSSDAESVSCWLDRFGISHCSPTKDDQATPKQDSTSADRLFEGIDPADLDMRRWLGEGTDERNPRAE